MGAVIRGTGSFLPDPTRHNDEVAARVGVTAAWIVERTGIHARHVAPDGMFTSDMAAAAGRRALEDAGWTPADLDLVLVATVSAEAPMPSAAARTAELLGARCAALDVGAACAGFVYGLGVAHGLIATGAARRVLLIGAELLSRWLDWDDRDTAVLFGDGAGAVALEADGGERGVRAVRFGGDPSQREALTLRDGVIRMHGPRIYRLAVRQVSAVSRAVCDAAGWSIDTIDWVAPHQANARVIDGISRRLGVPGDRVLVNIGRHGNTSAASIPVALDEAARDGRLQRGQRVIVSGLGAGLVWGAAALRW